MDFSIAGCDSWDSTPTQDNFIDSYFKKQSVCIANGNLKNTKKRSSSFVKTESKLSFAKPNLNDKSAQQCANQSLLTIQSRKSKNINLISPKKKAKVISNINKDEPISKHEKMSHSNVSIERESSIQMNNKKSTSGQKKESCSIVNVLKKTKKLKMLAIDDNLSLKYNKVASLNVSHKEENRTGKKVKKSKRKRSISKLLDASIAESVCQTSVVSKEPPEKSLPKTKKSKKHLKISPVLKNEIKKSKIDPEDSDEDIQLRNELGNTPIFQKLQKLIKRVPYLDPNFSGEEPDLDDSALNLSEFDTDDSSGESVHCPSSDDEPSMEDNTSLTEDNTPKMKPILKSKKQVPAIKTPNAVIVNDSVSLDVPLMRKNLKKDEKLKGMSVLKQKNLAKIQVAKFRCLNEKLYTESGQAAYTYFQENPEDYTDYHLGYSLQVSKWPMNPVDEIISNLQKLKQATVIADLGCGNAKIAQIFPDRVVHSFDLVPLNKFVTECDVSKVPLPNESVDVVVFCLSLMGVNLKEYLCEGHRILKLGGTLKIAEVESRIEKLDSFIKSLERMGFTLENKNVKHKLFVFLDLKKSKKKINAQKVPNIALRPCLYKKR